MRRFAITMGLAFQVGGLIACSVLGSFFVGLWLDRRLGTTPCLILLFVMIGLALAVLGAYRTANQMGERRRGGRSTDE